MLESGRQTPAVASAVASRSGWCLAPAKVNLSLRVLGRHADGYHLLESVMVPVSVYDCVHIRVRPGPSKVTCRVAGPERVPGGPDNLASRAAMALLSETGVTAQVAVRLYKRIPSGAGLGGGSSDAAAVLRLLARLLDLRLDPRRCARLAVTLGADVPFFVRCRPALARGIGELLDPLPHLPSLSLLVVVPPVRVRTAWAYAHALPRRLQRRAGSEHVSQPSEHARSLRLRRIGTRMNALFFNDFERGVGAHYPAVRQLARRLVQLGAEATVMSGSGSAVVGDFVTGADAKAAAAAFLPPDKAFTVRVLRSRPRLRLDGRSPSW